MRKIENAVHQQIVLLALKIITTPFKEKISVPLIFHAVTYKTVMYDLEAEFINCVKDRKRREVLEMWCWQCGKRLNALIYHRLADFISSTWTLGHLFKQQFDTMNGKLCKIAITHVVLCSLWWEIVLPATTQAKVIVTSNRRTLGYSRETWRKILENDDVIALEFIPAIPPSTLVNSPKGLTS